MMEFVALRAKAHAYLMEDGSEHKKAKGTEKCVIKREILSENYKDSLFNNQIILKSKQRFKSDHHEVYAEEVNKIALSSSDDKILQTSDKVTTYPYGANAFKVCENETLNRQQWASWLQWYPSVYWIILIYSTKDFYDTVNEGEGPELLCMRRIQNESANIVTI